MEELHVYVAGKKLTLDGIDNDYNGMFILDCGGDWISMIRTNVEEFAKYIVRELETYLNPKQKIDVIKVSFDITRPTILFCGDGYFGRPLIPYATMKNRELTKKQKKDLGRLINETGRIKLEEGKEIKLIA